MSEMDGQMPYAPLDDEAPAPVFQFLAVNGFIFRANIVTGDMDKLEPDPSDKKKQVWVRIEDRGVVHG